MDLAKKIFFLGTAIALGVLVGYEIAGPVSARDFTVLYSLDKQQNDQALVYMMDGARTYIYFAIYEFTKEDIAAALIRAKDRGLDVRGIMDGASRRTPNRRVLFRS